MDSASKRRDAQFLLAGGQVDDYLLILLENGPVALSLERSP